MLVSVALPMPELLRLQLRKKRALQFFLLRNLELNFKYTFSLCGVNSELYFKIIKLLTIKNKLFKPKAGIFQSNNHKNF